MDEFPDKAVPSTEPSIPWMNVQQDFSVAVLFRDRLVLGKELVLNFQINKSKKTASIFLIDADNYKQ